jgi:hypothetical protein
VRSSLLEVRPCHKSWDYFRASFRQTAELIFISLNIYAAGLLNVPSDSLDDRHTEDECLGKFNSIGNAWLVEQNFAPSYWLPMGNVAKTAERPPRICERCGASMKYVGKLPGSGDRALLMVYRCYNCQRIASDEVK